MSHNNFFKKEMIAECCFCFQKTYYDTCYDHRNLKKLNWEEDSLEINILAYRSILNIKNNKAILKYPYVEICLIFHEISIYLNLNFLLDMVNNNMKTNFVKKNIENWIFKNGYIKYVPSIFNTNLFLSIDIDIMLCNLRIPLLDNKNIQII